MFLSVVIVKSEDQLLYGISFWKGAHDVYDTLEPGRFEIIERSI